MFVLAAELRACVGYLLGGHSVQVVGSRGSGRSRLLLELEDEIQHHGRIVSATSGRASLWPEPFGPLTLLLEEMPRPRAGQELEDQLARLLASGRHVVLIDDADQLDEASAAVIATAVERTGTLVAATTSPGGARAAGVSRLSAASRAPMRVELVPRDFEAVTELVHDTLGGQNLISSEFAARVFSKSGGIPALVTAIAVTAREQRLIVARDGRWMMASDSLWCDQLRPTVEWILGGVTAEQERALRDLSWLAPVPLRQAFRTLDREVLVALESLGHAVTVGPQDAALLSVHPPLVADYFRAQGGPVSRFSLGQDPDGLVEQHVSAYRSAGIISLAASTREQRNAAIVRYFRDQGAVTVTALRAIWEDEPNVRNALGYLTAMLHYAGHHDDIDRVTQLTVPADNDTEDDQFRLVMLQAAWASFAKLDLEETKRILADFARHFPSWTGTVAAMEMTHDAGIDRVPPDYEERLSALRDEHPETLVVPIVHAYLDLVSGRPATALRRLETVDAGTAHLTFGLGRVIEPLAHFALGDIPAAAAAAARYRDAAIADLDRAGIYVSTYVAMLCELHRGDIGRADELAELPLAMGHPGFLLSHYYDAILTMSAITAVLDQHGSFAAGLLDSLRGQSDAVGSLPMMHAGYVEVVAELAAGGPPEQVAAALLAVAEDCATRGHRLSAAYAAATAIVLHPGRDILDAVEPVFGTTEAHPWRPLLEIARASLAGDEQRMRAAVAAVRPGQEHTTSVLLRSCARLAGSAEHSAARAAYHALLSRFPDVPVLEYRAAPSSSSLSARELQVALLAGTMSNSEVAAHLGLSPRTIENHISNALRKTGTRSRDELYARASRMGRHPSA